MKPGDRRILRAHREARRARWKRDALKVARAWLPHVAAGAILTGFLVGIAVWAW